MKSMFFLKSEDGMTLKIKLDYAELIDEVLHMLNDKVPNWVVSIGTIITTQLEFFNVRSNIMSPGWSEMESSIQCLMNTAKTPVEFESK